MIDLEDMQRLSRNRYYVIKSTGAVKRGIYSKKLKKTTGQKGLAQDVLKVSSSKIILYKNGNKLDCRKRNLRIIPKSKQNLSAGVSGSNSSGYKGVSYNRATKKYDAYIRHKYKKHNLGSHKTAAAAAKAYNKAAVKYFGEDFAHLNKV